MKVDLKFVHRQVEFDNCHTVHPRTGADTGLNLIFYVNHEGECWPTPILSGPYRNCTALPEGKPIDSYDKVIAILAKYHDDPEQIYYEQFIKPMQF